MYSRLYHTSKSTIIHRLISFNPPDFLPRHILTIDLEHFPVALLSHNLKHFSNLVSFHKSACPTTLIKRRKTNSFRSGSCLEWVINKQYT